MKFSLVPQIGAMLLLVTTTVTAQTVEIKSGTYGPQWANDIHGEQSVKELRKVVVELQAEVNLYQNIFNEFGDKLTSKLLTMTHTLDTRNKAINYIETKNGQQYAGIIPGSLKTQLYSLADRVGIKSVRWINVPKCVDWMIDSTYQIDVSNRESAIGELIEGYNLSYHIYDKDNSLNVTSLQYLEGCQ
ncbi:MAG: hypothetical protein HRT95_04070 [Moritella sp.]|uniref:hypothetical protein n=1 Tax=Moritella sp. TaxID=78556 RepID=UPI001D9277BB|nr:hypothetical protein [Moritella sp.]NQZ49380.1 hypothetical protein [Moritella sp.]